MVGGSPASSISSRPWWAPPSTSSPPSGSSCRAAQPAVASTDVLLSYGYAEAALDEALEHRLLAYGLLHRYSNLPWFLERVPPPPHVRTLPELASVWWGLR